MVIRALTFLFFVFSLCSELIWAEGSLVIHCNVPEAKVYLDGNYVASANAEGYLKIDQLPDGKFLVAVKQPGFYSRQREVDILRDQMTILRVDLLPLKAAREPTPAATAPRATREERAPSPSLSPPSSAPLEAGSSRSEASSPLDLRPVVYIIVIFTIGIAALLTLFYFLKTRLPLRMRVSGTAEGKNSHAEASPAFVDSSSDAPEPDRSRDGTSFLAELEHREELLRAGFLPDAAPERKKRKPLKEPTITLKKDDYEIEK